MRFLIGAVMIIAGYCLVRYSEWLFQNFGTIPMADKYLKNSGGGRLGYKLFGLLFIFAGIFTITGIHTQVLETIARILVPGA